MVRFIVIATLALIGTAAHATGQHGGDKNQGSIESNINVHNKSESHSTSKSNASAYAKGGTAVQGQDASSTNSIVYEAKKIPVSTAYAAALAASQGTCMGSSSVGGQGVGFGVSFGSTWNDKNCNNRLNATLAHTFGFPDVALALLCNNDGVRDAVALTGRNCPQGDVDVGGKIEGSVRKKK